LEYARRSRVSGLVGQQHDNAEESCDAFFAHVFLFSFERQEIHLFGSQEARYGDNFEERYRHRREEDDGVEPIKERSQQAGYEGKRTRGAHIGSH
jgi:hypothetical protein